MEMRDKILSFVNKLQKVQSRGRDSWVACCPAHDDKNPSLKIDLKNDKILIKCWSGCDTESILGAVGMDFDDIFPDKPIYQRSSGKQPTLSSADALRIVKNEARIIWMMANDIRRNKTINDADHARFLLAMNRVDEAMEAAGVKL